MRGAFGKPQGTVARVRIGQPIMSVRSSDRWKAAVIEALRRAKFKFPGRQKVLFILAYFIKAITDMIRIYYIMNINKKLRVHSLNRQPAKVQTDYQKQTQSIILDKLFNKIFQAFVRPQ